MEELLKHIKVKRAEYKAFKQTLHHDMNTAKKLGFDTEVNKLENDKRWCQEIIDLLDGLESKVN